MLKRIARLFESIFSRKSTESHLSEVEVAADSDPVAGNPGLHVLSAYGSEHALISPLPTEDIIRKTLGDLDWKHGFFQVILVRDSGELFEVGGSLDPSDGLSSLYEDPAKDVYLVTSTPPESIDQMTDLLLSFHRNDGQWRDILNYE